MTTELYWLALTLLMTAAMALTYITDRLIVRGPWQAVAGDVTENVRAQSAWAQRAINAHRNAIENLAVFAPAVLALAMLHISTPQTRLAAAAYFFARAVHFVVYAAGIPVVRTLAYSVGLVAQFTLILAILGWG